MKIRNGFVSNSSSASFVVVWKDRKPRSLKAALSSMFDVQNFDEDDDKFPWERSDDLLESLTERIYQNRVDMAKCVNEDPNEVDREMCKRQAQDYIDDAKSKFNVCDRVVKCTRETDKGFVTTFPTCMFNDYRDFGAEDLVTAIAVYNDFEIVSSYVEGGEFSF